MKGGNPSGTRQMRDFLLLLVEEKGYRLAGRYVAGDNALSLWIAVAPWYRVVVYKRRDLCYTVRNNAKEGATMEELKKYIPIYHYAYYLK